MKHKHRWLRKGWHGEWLNHYCTCGVSRAQRYKMGSNTEFEHKYCYPKYWKWANLPASKIKYAFECVLLLDKKI